MYLDRTCPVLHWCHEEFVLWQSLTHCFHPQQSNTLSQLWFPAILTACHQDTLHSIHRFVHLVSKDKIMVSPSLATFSKASNGMFDGITLCTERSDYQLILALARHRGHEIRARDCSPGWVVDKNGKAWMESFISFMSWLLFCSWSSLRKDPWRSHATAAGLAEGK